ncbi:hypothetical protein HOLleu_19137 [Holothuria leucospilota]|uniref:Uncharacterized protein n=1 Tax=Holothuria leucospilota TaxID=206669 RepID=A0A9Q1HA68_HOLLE|nr:hypothetical protein HOLleu_19137 [Holothuria leucospilota]
MGDALGFLSTGEPRLSLPVRPPREKNWLLPNGVEAKTGPAPDATDRSKRAAASASQGTVCSRPDLITMKKIYSGGPGEAG